MLRNMAEHFVVIGAYALAFIISLKLLFGFVSSLKLPFISPVASVGAAVVSLG